MKSGLVVLIPKCPPYDEIGNYRPITLLNCDYKIFTKILSNRLQPILEIIIHESQYAQPGKDINEMNCLVRDLVDEMKSRTNLDSFFVSIDFQKAYDTICHTFLFQILEKYGFPICFIEVIKELFRDAGSHILINKFRSKKFKLHSGTQQGNPLSRDLFTIQINPLLEFLNVYPMIEKYASLSNRKFLTLAFMDDANLVTSSLSSIITAMFYANKYEKASGLAVNLNKTKGMFCNHTGRIHVNALPAIQWSSEFTCLKINYGQHLFINNMWTKRITKFMQELHFFSDTAFTMKAKAALSKNKLFSLLSYIGTVHEIPLPFRKRIEKALLKFIVPFLPSRDMNEHDISRKIMCFAAPTCLGGIQIDNISLHLDLLLLKTVMQYLRCLTKKIILPDNLWFVEYNIGFQLCQYFKLPYNNRTPHAFSPNSFYGRVLQIIRAHKISLQELSERNVNYIYKRIVCDNNQSMINFKSYRISVKILPSYLQSFNYKLHFNLLPVKSMFKEWQLDNDSSCLFCNVGYETVYHLFGTCEKLKGLWAILKNTHYQLFNEHFDYNFVRCNFNFDLVNISLNQRRYEKTLVYLNTVVNYNIWRYRNDCRYRFKEFNLKDLMSRIAKSIGYRKRVDQQVTDSFKVPFINLLYNKLVGAINLYPFDNG